MGPDIVYPSCYLGRRVAVWTTSGNCVRGILKDFQVVEVMSSRDSRSLITVIVLDQWFGTKDGPYQMFNFDNVESVEPLGEPVQKKEQL